MRIRTIKPEFFTHGGLFDLEQETKLPIRLAYAGLWCAADRDGRFKWDPRRLGIAILPYEKCDFSRVLDALMTRGFIIRYRVNGEVYGFIPTFERHQIINNRERSSEIPDVSLSEDVDECGTREPRVEHASKAEGKGREQGKEGKGSALHAHIPDELFDIQGFYEEWSAFLDHRKKLKRPMTERAEELILSKLQKRPADALKALRMTLEKGWQSFEWAWIDNASAPRSNGYESQQPPARKPLPPPVDYRAMAEREDRERREALERGEEIPE